MRACQVARSRWTIPSVTLIGAAAATGSVTGTARGRWQILVRFIDGTLSVVTVSLSGTGGPPVRAVHTRVPFAMVGRGHGRNIQGTMYGGSQLPVCGGRCRPDSGQLVVDEPSHRGEIGPFLNQGGHSFDGKVT